jgi:hypothetical protein
MREDVHRIAVALLWMVLAGAIALGAAGLASGADRPPGTAARPELTYVRDREVDALLETASEQMADLGDLVAALGVQARGALAALNGTEIATAEAAIAEGDRLLDQMTSRTATMRLELAAIPYVSRTDTALLVSDRIVARHVALVAALDTTNGLQADWARLTSGSVAAIQLGTLLAEHDRRVTEATSLGRAARYVDAMAGLDRADLTIGSARALRDALANTVDVTVLDQWLDRNAAYDVALRGLYAAYSKLGGKVTEALREAIAAEAAARTNLPPDTRGLVVIMAEIGRGGMTGAVIAIEEARGRLIAAIEAASAIDAGPPIDGKSSANP